MPPSPPRARRLRGEKAQQLPAAQLPAVRHRPVRPRPMYLEAPLCQIDPDDANLLHWMPPPSDGQTSQGPNHSTPSWHIAMAGIPASHPAILADPLPEVIRVSLPIITPPPFDGEATILGTLTQICIFLCPLRLGDSEARVPPIGISGASPRAALQRRPKLSSVGLLIAAQHRLRALPSAKLTKHLARQIHQVRGELPR